MKILALIFCPFVFFALRQQLGKALVACLPTYAFWFLISLDREVTFIVFVIIFIATIIWVIQTNAYKSFNKLPKYTFTSVFLPFAILFDYKRKTLGMLAIVSMVFGYLCLKGALRFHASKLEEEMAILFVFLIFGSLHLSFSLFSLMKCVSTSLETQETQEQAPTPSPTAPSQRASHKFSHADLAKLLTLPNDQLIEFLKDKTPKEIATIQTSLEDLPIKQQIPIKKAIKEVLGELENI